MRFVDAAHSCVSLASIRVNICTRELVNYAVESVLNEIGFEEGE